MGAHHRHAGSESSQLRRLAIVVVAPLALATLAALVWMWPPGAEVETGASAPEVRGTITAIQVVECAEGLSRGVNGCGVARVDIDTVPNGGDLIVADLPHGPGAPEVETGDAVVLIQTETPDGEVYSIVDHQRASGLWVLGIAFVLALVAFGRWRGLTALVGLAVTFAVLLWFVVPAILNGQSPMLVAIVGSAAIALTVLYLTHGFSLWTTVAVLGTLASLAVTAALSAVSVWALHLTGITDDVSSALGTSHTVNMEGLLLAGIVIGTLGVLDDVTITQAATVSEINRANPSFSARQLYVAGTRVGRSHIASVVNTIILAYAGSSLPLLILILASSDSLGGVVTDQVIAQEVVRSVVGTLGLIAAVPVTTGLASLAARAAQTQSESQEPAASE